MSYTRLSLIRTETLRIRKDRQEATFEFCENL